MKGDWRFSIVTKENQQAREEEILEKAKEYYQENRTEIIEKQKKDRKNNPEKYKQIEKRKQEKPLKTRTAELTNR